MGTGDSAAIVQLALEELHAQDAKCEKDERTQGTDVDEFGDRSHDGPHEHGHAWHAFECTERPQGTNRSNHREVSE